MIGFNRQVVIVTVVVEVSGGRTRSSWRGEASIALARSVHP
jgi:hypothetical protein